MRNIFNFSEKYLQLFRERSSTFSRKIFNFFEKDLQLFRERSSTFLRKRWEFFGVITSIEDEAIRDGNTIILEWNYSVSEATQIVEGLWREESGNCVYDKS